MLPEFAVEKGAVLAFEVGVCVRGYWAPHYACMGAPEVKLDREQGAYSKARGEPVQRCRQTRRWNRHGVRGIVERMDGDLLFSSAGRPSPTPSHPVCLCLSNAVVGTARAIPSEQNAARRMGSNFEIGMLSSPRSGKTFRIRSLSSSTAFNHPQTMTTSSDE
jgi:hypothetical protein